MELTSGASLQGGKYRIISSLGQGGFGITYLAEHTTLGAHVCIKEFFIKDFCNRSDDGSVISVVSENSRADIDGFKRKFLDEARKLYKIKHNHIVSVTDLFEENNTAYYVMDYIEGETLQSRINREGALSESDARRYICEVAEALRYIHENSMLHLDIKPGNIMVRSNGDTAIVIDFGLAKHYDPKTGHQTTTYLGAQSPGYAPFEQGLSGGGVKMFCPATDIYSLGATLFALVTAVRPPEAAAIPNEGLPELPAHLMPSTREAITRAMEYSIKSRPQSIDEFLSIINAQSANVHQHAADIVATPLADNEATRVTASTSNGSSTLKIEQGIDALTIKRQYRRELILVLFAEVLAFVCSGLDFFTAPLLPGTVSFLLALFVKHSRTNINLWNKVFDILFYIIILFIFRDTTITHFETDESKYTLLFNNMLYSFLAYTCIKSFLLYKEHSIYSASIYYPIFAFIPALFFEYLIIPNAGASINISDYYGAALNITAILWVTIYLYVKRNIQLSKLQ